MLNYIWGIMIITSIICAIFTNNIEILSKSVLDGSSSAVNLLLVIAGMMSLWTGILKIAESAGLTSMLSKAFSPLLKLLFKNLQSKDNNKTLHFICMNITANLLGMGNAATPLGIAAMKEMKKLSNNSAIASNDMIMFVVINTTSIQLIPAMITVLRQKYGALSPLDIAPAIWISSVCALIVGITLVKVFEK